MQEDWSENRDIDIVVVIHLKTFACLIDNLVIDAESIFEMKCPVAPAARVAGMSHVLRVWASFQANVDEVKVASAIASDFNDAERQAYGFCPDSHTPMPFL